MSFLDDNNNRLIGTPVGADISSWGDLAFTLWGNLGQLRIPRKSQSREAGRGIGKYTSVWMRQQDGTSELVLDRGNASPPPMYP